MSAGPVVLLARHAPVAVAGVCYGQCDVPTKLDDHGAARALLGEITTGGWAIDRVWCSPWARTLGPAARVAERLGVPLSIDVRLSEIAFGTWEGRRYADLERDPAFLPWMHDWRRARPPGGEVLEELVARVRAWSREAGARRETALAVTHAGVIRVLRADAEGREMNPSEPVDPLRIETIVMSDRY